MSIMKRLAGQVGQMLRRDATPLAAWAVTMAGMVAACWLLPHLPADAFGLARWPWLQWYLWDASHYVDIARHGYLTTGPDAVFIVFYPALPALIWVMHWLTWGNFIAAGYVLAGVTGLLALMAAMRLARLDGDEPMARRMVWLLALAPTAMYLHLPYTEGLFLAFVMGTFYFIRTGRLGVGLALAALATATRLHGLALVPAIMVEVWQLDQWRMGGLVKGIRCAAVAALGFGLYLMLNLLLFGSLWYFLIPEHEHWRMVAAWPWTGLLETIQRINQAETTEQLFSVRMQLAAAAAGGVAVVYSFVRLRLSYAVFALSAWWLSLSTTLWVSVPRYMLVLFPLYIMLARWGDRPVVLAAELIISGGLFVLYVVMALLWQPVF